MRVLVSQDIRRIVLSFRFLVVAGVSTIALWGLFQLLDNLQEPGLLRSQQAVILKGCDSPDSDSARRLCPQFMCQKALIDRKLAPLNSRFEISIDKQSPTQRLIGGRATAPGANAATFVCLGSGMKIDTAALTEPDRLQALAQQTGDWKL